MIEVTFNETPCPHCDPGPRSQGYGYGHWLDCPTLTASPAIVRELAERGPFLQVDVFGDAMGDACADSTCLAQDGDLHDPANHAPACLWRRARELYPEPAT